MQKTDMSSFNSIISQIKDIPSQLKDGTIKFVDLGLPSGLYWAFIDAPRYFSLKEVSEEIETIPTVEQFKELFKNCKFRLLVGGRGNTSLIAEGPTGSYIHFECRGQFLRNIIGYVYYWVRDLESNTLKVLKMKDNKDFEILEYESIKTKSIRIKRVQSI